MRTQRRAREEWRWSWLLDVPPDGRPCPREGWSAGGGNIHEEESDAALVDGFCMWHGQKDPAGGTCRSCDGTYSNVPEGRLLGRRENGDSELAPTDRYWLTVADMWFQGLPAFHQRVTRLPPWCQAQSQLGGTMKSVQSSASQSLTVYFFTV